MCIATNPNPSATAEHEPRKDGSVWSKVKKGVSNCKAYTVTSSKNTKETFKIQQAKMKIVERKKAFGVEFLGLMEEDAPEADLETCVEEAMRDLDRLKEKMTRWAGLIAQNKENLQRKISSRSHGHAGATTTSGTVSAVKAAPYVELETDEDSEDGQSQVTMSSTSEMTLEEEGEEVELSSFDEATEAAREEALEGTVFGTDESVEVVFNGSDEDSHSELDSLAESTVEATPRSDTNTGYDVMLEDIKVAPSFDEGSETSAPKGRKEVQGEATVPTRPLPSVLVRMPTDEVKADKIHVAPSVETKIFEEGSEISEIASITSSAESFNEAMEALRQIVQTKEEKLEQKTSADEDETEATMTPTSDRSLVESELEGEEFVEECESFAELQKVELSVPSDYAMDCID